MKLAVVVLAAGLSRRFGNRDKLLAPLDGRPVAAHLARALRGVPRHDAIVVLRDRRLAGLFAGFQACLVAPARPGQGISLAAGIGAARRGGASHVLLVLADMPHVTAPDLRRILRGALTHPVMAVGDKPRAAMPPALIPRRLFAQLSRLRGDRGAGPVLRRCPDLILRDLAPAHLHDIDRPADLGTARQAKGDCSRSSGIFR